MGIKIETIQNLVDKGEFLWSQHCLERIQERNISRDSVFKAIAAGEIIESYDDDFPHPSCLILGFENKSPLHVVCGCDGSTVFVVTAYVPDKTKFESDFKTRKINKQGD